MKGIILAGGIGSRLYPITRVTSKQLLPVYSKPMIYYPLSTLMSAGIREILLISASHDLPAFRELLGDGSDLGITVRYKVQPSPDGLAQAFILGRDFIGDDCAAMVLGDNIFYGEGLPKILKDAADATKHKGRAVIFGCRADDPTRFGVISFDRNGHVTGIEEKPARPKSPYAVTGLYFYPPGVANKAEMIRPSKRGELEITDLNELYRKEGLLDVQLLDDGFTWLDAGTVDSLFRAAAFVESVETKQGKMISVPEEIAYLNGWISREQIIAAAAAYEKTHYGEYLLSV